MFFFKDVGSAANSYLPFSVSEKMMFVMRELAPVTKEWVVYDPTAGVTDSSGLPAATAEERVSLQPIARFSTVIGKVSCGPREGEVIEMRSEIRKLHSNRKLFLRSTNQLIKTRLT